MIFIKATFLILAAASLASATVVPTIIESTDLQNLEIQQDNAGENSIRKWYSTTTTVEDESVIINTSHVYTEKVPNNYKRAVGVLKYVHCLVVKHMELDVEDLLVCSLDACVTAVEKIVKCLRMVCERGIAFGCRAKRFGASTVIDIDYLKDLKGRLDRVKVSGQYKYHSVLYPILFGRPYGKPIHKDSLHEGVIMVSMAYLAVTQSVSTKLDRFVFESTDIPTEPFAFHPFHTSEQHAGNELSVINVDSNQDLFTNRSRVGHLPNVGPVSPHSDVANIFILDLQPIWSASSDSERESLAFGKLIDIHNRIVLFLGVPSLQVSSEMPPSMYVESILQSLILLSQRALSGPIRRSDWSCFILNPAYFERVLFMASNWMAGIYGESSIMDVLLPVMAPVSCSQASARKPYQVVIFMCKVYLSMGQCLFVGLDGYHFDVMPLSCYSFTVMEEMNMLGLWGSEGEEKSSMHIGNSNDSVLGKRKATVEQLEGSDIDRPSKRARIDVGPIVSNGENHDQLIRHYGNMLTDEEIGSLFEDKDFSYKF